MNIEDVGSSPTYYPKIVLVAQLVEHLIEDQSVVGSNPTGNTRECSRVG